MTIEPYSSEIADYFNRPRPWRLIYNDRGDFSTFHTREEAEQHSAGFSEAARREHRIESSP